MAESAETLRRKQLRSDALLVMAQGEAIGQLLRTASDRRQSPENIAWAYGAIEQILGKTKAATDSGQ